MQISTILDQIDLGSIALPEFQRGYVWNRDQVRGLMDSLYRRHPVGSLLVWVTKAETATTRGGAALPPGTVKLLLDGQQRMTSLYGIVRGRPPEFFDGNAQAFTGLCFHLGTETFAFYSPLRMREDPLWIDVTELMRKGIGPFAQRFAGSPEHQEKLSDYISRLNQVDSIKQIDLHIEEVTGADKTVDIVVDIFNRVNSGGTKLSKGDLALAKVCAEWPEARNEMKARLDKWRNAGFHIRLELLLRCVNTVLSDTAFFSALADVDRPAFETGLKGTERYIDNLLNLIGARLGLDHDRVLGSRYAFPLMCRYLAVRDGKFANHQERDRLLFWYVHTLLWGRYAGSTESVLNQDLEFIRNPDRALDRLMEGLRRDRGDLRVHPDDFLGWSKGARFYPLLYMLTRVWEAKDWESGIELSGYMLGKHSQLELHHIFPRAMLYRNEYAKAEVNALANFTFLTKETNIRVSDEDPGEYLEAFASKNPGVLESHWIPMDRDLWKVGNYRDFLSARRELLAKAANDFLDSLLAGPAPSLEKAPSITEREVQPPSDLAAEDEDALLISTNEWVVEQGLPEGEFLFELADPVSGEALAVFDLAWPEGLQEGLSQPVALLIDESTEVEEAANRAGYRFFTDADAFRDYVSREILAADETSEAA